MAAMVTVILRCGLRAAEGLGRYLGVSLEGGSLVGQTV